MRQTEQVPGLGNPPARDPLVSRRPYADFEPACKVLLAYFLTRRTPLTDPPARASPIRCIDASQCRCATSIKIPTHLLLHHPLTNNGVHPPEIKGMPARQPGGLPASHAGLPPKPGMVKNVSPTTRRSSMRSAGASGTQGAGLAGNKDAATTNMPEVENFGPPAWRSVLNSKADLGE